MSTATAGKQIIQAPQLGQTIHVTPSFQQNDSSLASTANPAVALATVSKSSNILVSIYF